MLVDGNIARRIVDTIHSVPGLAGAVIGLYDGEQCRSISQGYPGSIYSSRIAVIVEVVESDGGSTTSELQGLAQAGPGSAAGPVPNVVRNDSNMAAELIGAGANCFFAAAAALGVVGGVAGEIPTGGASSFLVVASWVGMTSSALLCANGLVRVSQIALHPDSNSLQDWDSNTVYSVGFLFVDAAGVASGVAALPYAIRNFAGVLSRQRSFIARGLSFEKLRLMNRFQRATVIREVLNEASKVPEGRAALLAAAKEANVATTSLGRGSLSVRHSTSIVNIISKETSRRLLYGMKDILTTVGSGVASATPPQLSGSASGSVNWLINLVDSG